MEENESELKNFLIERIERLGGSAQLQYLVGILKNVPNDIQTSVASNRAELLRFLRKYSNVFEVDANCNVKLHPSSTSYQDTENKSNSSESFSKKSKESLPQTITGEGIVSKIAPTFGFISAKSPFKTTIYFTPSKFGDKNKTLFTEFEGLAPGRKICFNARKGSDNHDKNYRATKVWYPKDPEIKQENISYNPKKTRETGLYDPVQTEGEGKVGKLFSTFGFIFVDNDKNNTVFFHKDTLANIQNVTDLTKALQIGSLVRFKALRNEKKDIKARWCANKVWLIKGGKIKTSTNPSNVENKKQERQIIKNEKGKIFPNKKGGIIKFGNKFEKVADADSSLFYMFGSLVKDVSWEFSDGDNVFFDGYEIKSAPGWKASLVWTGNRPNVVTDIDLGEFGDDCDTDNFQEASSFVSKSSDNSTKSAASDKSLKNSKFKSSNDVSTTSAKYTKSNKLSSNESLHRDFDADNFSDSASYHSNRSSNASTLELGTRNSKRRRNRHNSKEFHRGDSQGKMPRNSNHKNNLNNKGRFQRHLEFVSSNLKGSIDSIDNKSVCSNASNENLTFLQPANINNVYKNWGDSPYPGEDDDNLDIPGDFDNSGFENKIKNDDFVNRDSVVKSSLPMSKVSNGCSDLSESSSSDNSDNEMFNCEDDLNETVKELDEPTSSLCDFLKNGDQTVDKSADLVKKASVKIFHEIEGAVKKVYCKYAEMESSKLSKSASFFYNDLYLNGISVTEEFDDLREVIKVGEVLKLNCIEIIDNDGICFTKPTVVWKGKKPSVVEITPAQYISDNKFSVSVSEDCYVNYYPNDNLNPVSQNSSNSIGSEVKTREPDKPIKFLTVASDLGNSEFESTSSEDEENVSDESINVGTSETENIRCIEEENLDNESFSVRSSENEKETNFNTASFNIETENIQHIEQEVPDHLILPSNRTEVISAISKIMKFKVSPDKSLMELDVLSTEILNLVLNSNSVNAVTSDSLDISHKETQTETSEINSVSPDAQAERIKEIKHTECQTIFTGEVIGKNIYFDENTH